MLRLGVLAVVFVASGICAAYAPIFPTRSQVREQHRGVGGDVIRYVWHLQSVVEQAHDLKYDRDSTHKKLWLVLGVLGCLALAFGAQMLVGRLLWPAGAQN